MNALIRRHRARGVLIDSGPLLLLLVGMTGRERIRRFDRTKDNYTAAHFDMLREMIGQFSRIITTPNILTEVGNLAGKMRGEWLDDFRAAVAEIIQSEVKEKYRPSRLIVKTPPFSKVGLADAASIQVARQGGYLLLTSDRELCGRAKREKVAAVNFDELHLIFSDDDF